MPRGLHARKGAGSSPNDCWRQKTRVPGLSRDVVYVILRLAVLIQYRRVTDTHTHTHTVANTSAAQVKTVHAVLENIFEKFSTHCVCRLSATANLGEQ